jgi:NADH-quinone oxidoreductase subunit J
MIFGMPITGQTVAFFILALIIITSGVLLMTQSKVMHMALSLGGVFLGVAGIFVLLGADFLGIVQVLIYAGAITILMVFALMLTQKGDDTSTPNTHPLRGLLTLIGAAGLAVILLIVLRNTPWTVSRTAVDPYTHSTVALIAQALYHQYTLPFELVSLVLTVALVGAAVIARKEEES